MYNINRLFIIFKNDLFGSPISALRYIPHHCNSGKSLNKWVADTLDQVVHSH